MNCAATSLALKGLKLIAVHQIGDRRGFFCETYNARIFAGLGIAETFVQDNHTFSSEKGTIRGLHFQRPPHAQSKLVRVSRGSVLDVVVDIRKGSPTYGKYVAVELSAKNWLQLFIPQGFAHGFCTLEPDSELQYKVSAYYEPSADAGVLWNDPHLSIAWPDFAGTQLSPRDAALPTFAQCDSPFSHG